MLNCLVWASKWLLFFYHTSVFACRATFCQYLCDCIFVTYEKQVVIDLLLSTLFRHFLVFIHFQSVWKSICGNLLALGNPSSWTWTAKVSAFYFCQTCYVMWLVMNVQIDWQCVQYVHYHAMIACIWQRRVSVNRWKWIETNAWLGDGNTHSEI